jgi:hypothetical protein
MKLAVGSLCFVACVLSAGVVMAQGSGPGVGVTPVAPLPYVPIRAQQPPLIDLNSAVLDKLLELPGMDSGIAQKIIDGRPYKSMKEFKEKKIVPDTTYKLIKDRVETKKPKVKK